LPFLESPQDLLQTLQSDLRPSRSTSDPPEDLPDPPDDLRPPQARLLYLKARVPLLELKTPLFETLALRIPIVFLPKGLQLRIDPFALSRKSVWTFPTLPLYPLSSIGDVEKAVDLECCCRVESWDLA